MMASVVLFEVNKVCIFILKLKGYAPRATDGDGMSPSLVPLQWMQVPAGHSQLRQDLGFVEEIQPDIKALMVTAIDSGGFAGLE
jgi:hypothetical protein